MMDDNGQEIRRPGSIGHDIGPDEIFRGPTQERTSENGFRQVYMVRNPYPGDGFEGMEVEYEPVLVRNWPQPEPLDETPTRVWSGEGTRCGNSSSSASPLYSERNRLDTFRTTWLDSYLVRAEDLARNGFYYIGPGDKVKCVFCLKTLRGWEPGDTVEGEHEKHYPTCPFVRGVCQDQNIPISAPSVMRVNLKSNECMYPAYAEVYERLKTLEAWPFPATVSAERLADAGFFFTGKRDLVKCFHCGKIVCSWERGDDPFKEHAKLYPNCHFVKEKKEKMKREQEQQQRSQRSPQRRPAEVTGATGHSGSPVKNGYHSQSSQRAEDGKNTQQKPIDPRQCTEPSEMPQSTLERDMKGSAAQAILQMGEMTVEDLRKVLEELRITKGSDGKINAEEILNHFDNRDSH